MKYEWQPIADYLGGNVAEQARRLGVDRTQVYRWQKGMTRDQAEDVCDRLRLHPLEFWPDFFDEFYKKCAAPDCDERFVQAFGKGRKTQLYCSRRCQVRTNRRARYRADPRRDNAMSRRYKREARALARRRREGVVKDDNLPTGPRSGEALLMARSSRRRSASGPESDGAGALGGPVSAQNVSRPPVTIGESTEQSRRGVA